MGLSKVSIIKVLKAFLPLMNFLKLTQDESCLNQKAFLPFKDPVLKPALPQS